MRILLSFFNETLRNNLSAPLRAATTIFEDEFKKASNVGNASPAALVPILKKLEKIKSAKNKIQRINLHSRHTKAVRISKCQQDCWKLLLHVIPQPTNKSLKRLNDGNITFCKPLERHLIAFVKFLNISCFFWLSNELWKKRNSIVCQTAAAASFGILSNDQMMPRSGVLSMIACNLSWFCG